MHQLDIEPRLLAYLAGELTDAERGKVERMLAADAGLRESYEALREAYAEVGGAFRSADAAEPLPLSAATAAKRFGRVIRARHAGEFAASSPAAAPAAHASAPAAAANGTAATRAAVAAAGLEQANHRFRVPGWAYPIATAATIVLAFAVWQGMTRFGGRETRDNRPAFSLTNIPPGMSYPMASPATPVDDSFDYSAWSRPNLLDDSDDVATASVLSETEDELYTLSLPAADDGDGDVTTTLLLGELE